MLEALSRFNVRANIKRDINSIVAANLVRKRNGRKKYRRPVESFGRGKVRCGRILFYTADMPYQRGKWSTLA